MKTKFKILTIVALFFTSIGNIYSQKEVSNKNERENNQIETLFSKDQKITHGGYAGFEFGYTQIVDRPAIITGFHAAWVIDHTIELGIIGKGYITNPVPDLNLENESYMYTGGYGGLHIAANVFGNKPINVTFPLTVGAGSISYIKTQYYDLYNNYYDDCYAENHYAYLVLEPGVEVQLNMTRFFRISAGISYRYTSDIYLIYSNTNSESVINPSIMRGINAGIKLKFGKF